MMQSFFASAKSYGKWDKTSSETLTENDKATIAKAEVIENNYGQAVCFFLKGTNRVKLFQLEEDCELSTGAQVDIDSVIFNHYTDGEKISTRVVCNELSD